MLDIAYIRENPDLIKKASKDKKIPCDVDRLLAVDGQRRTMLQEVEALRSAQNKASKSVAKATPEEREKLLSESKKLSDELKKKEEELKPVEEQFRELMLTVPSVPHPDVPVGPDESGNVQLRTWGTIPTFNFTPKSHIELGLDLDIIDFERGAKVGGGRSYYLKGDGALLQWAVLRAAIDHIAKKGFTLMDVPLLVKERAMVGTGYFPFGRDDAYYIEKDALSLVGTAEVSLASYHTDEILTQKSLPRLYAGFSPCFRREAGSYGKDTKGLYRVHQFEKVEQVVLCTAEQAAAQHEFILKNAEEFLQSLGLPYQVMLLCTAELGAGQIKKYDIETWMPSRGNYGETHSCSNLGEFQSRRLGIRYKDEAGKVQFVHTLNNTVIAAPRVLIPILEIYQQADGSVKIPDVLQPYLSGKKYIGK